MRDIKMLIHETIPCWYELSWRGHKGKPGILLRIRTDFIERTEKMLPEPPIAREMMKEFNFQKFSAEFDRDFGFEDALKFAGVSKDGFVEYVVPTPLVRITEGKCEHCKGSGNDKELGIRCLCCEKGKKVRYDWQPAFAVSASLSLLFDFLSFPDIETDAAIPQLLTVRTVTLRNAHGGSLGGDYSRETVDYLRSRPVGDVPEMVKAMRAVFTRMEGGIPDFNRHYFWARTQGSDGWLNVTCPGDACGLHPEGGHLGGSEGYAFACHNVDNPLQQMVLLASLGALHDLVRGKK